MELEIISPHIKIEQLFAQSSSTLNSPRDWGVGAYFARICNDPGALANIPTLSRHNMNYLKPGSLVKYRGMVQDSFDPEYYQAITSIVHETTGEKRLLCSKYRDLVPTIPAGYLVEQTSVSSKSTASRQPLFCVPIPGENNWARREYTSAAVGASGEEQQCVQGNTNKRCRDVENGDGNSHGDGNRDGRGDGCEDGWRWRWVWKCRWRCK